MSGRRGILVVFRQNAAGALLGFQVSGHADYAQWGNDIVCAAVSALAQTTALGLQQAVGLGERLHLETRPGFLDCRLPQGLARDEKEKAALLLQTLRAGLLAVAESYAGYVQVQDQTV